MYYEYPSGVLLFPTEDRTVATDVALVWWDFGPPRTLRLSGPSGEVDLDIEAFDNGMYGFRVARPRQPLEPESLYVASDGSSAGYFSTGSQSESASPGAPALEGVCGERGAGSDCGYYYFSYELPELEGGFYLVEIEQADHSPRHALMAGDESPTVGSGVCGSTVELADESAPLATRVATLGENGELSAWSDTYTGALGAVYEEVCFEALDLDGEGSACGCEGGSAMPLLVLWAVRRRLTSRCRRCRPRLRR